MEFLSYLLTFLIFYPLTYVVHPLVYEFSFGLSHPCLELGILFFLSLGFSSLELFKMSEIIVSSSSNSDEREID